MATLTYDFEDDAVGSSPAGWSYNSHTGSAYTFAIINLVSKRLGMSSTVGTVLADNDDAASLEDAVFEGTLRKNGAANSPFVVLRSNGGSITTFSGYQALAGNNTLYLQRIDSGSGTVLDSTAATITASLDYVLKLEVSGTTIRAKIWEEGDAEPGAWTLTTTDSTYTSGTVQIGCYLSGSFDDISIESDDISTDVDVDQDPVGEIDVAGYDPAVLAPIGVHPTLGTLSVSGYDPSVFAGINVVPGGLGGEIKIASYDPIAKLSVHTTPGAGAVGITGYDPELGFPINAAPVGDVNITGYNPTVAASASEVHLYFKFRDTAGNVWTREIDAKPPVVEVTTTYIASSVEEVIWADASGGAFNITLPTVTGRNGFTYEIKKTDSSANAVTIVGTIDGDANFDLEFQHESVTLKAGDSGWGIM